MANLINHTIGRYDILKQLGQGGMATVYIAYDTHLDTTVAIKVIRTEMFAPIVLERILKRFEQEAKLTASLNHVNIVKVTDYGEYNGQPYLVMPYHTGGTLKQYLNHPLDWQKAFELLIPIANALAYAHKRESIHRDVKPSNILMTDSGQPVLTDFGIAKILDIETGISLTGTGNAVGTPEYMSPEQADGKDVDGRSDVYALGIVLYELITGRKPFEAETPLAVLIKHAHDPLPRPSYYVEGLPIEVEYILFKALAKKREDRYETMDAFYAAMAKLLRDGAKSPQITTPDKPDEVQKPKFEPLPDKPSKQQPGGQPPDTIETIDDLSVPPKRERTQLPKWLLPTSLAALGTALILLLVFGVIVPEVEKNTAQAAQIASNTQTAESSTHEANQSATSVAESTQKAVVRIQGMTATAKSWTQTPTMTMTPSKTATRKPTSTLTPTQTVIPVDKILYENNFESQSVVGWDNRSNTPFSFLTENGNQYLHFKATGFAYPGFYYLTNTNNWKNYAFESRIRTDYYLAVCFRAYGKNASFYNFHFDPAENWIGFADYDYSRGDENYLSFGDSTSFIPDNQWITLRIEAKDDTLKAFINNRLVASESRSSLSYGGIGYNMAENSEIDVDDIRVWSLD